MTALQKTETPLAGGVRAKLDSTFNKPILAAEEQACNGQVADWRSRKALWIPHAQFTLKNRPARTYEAITLGKLFEYVAAGRPTRAAKGESPGLIPSSYLAHDAREKAAQLQHGQYSALWVDIDKGSPSGAQVLRAVKGLVGDCAFAIWSTASATEEAPRWRVLVVLAYPVGAEQWLILQTALAFGLKEAGIETDDSAERVYQILYTPNIPPDRWQDDAPVFFRIKVNNVSQAWQQGLGNLDQHIEAARQHAALRAAEATARREAAEKRRAELAVVGGGETPVQRALAHLGDVVEVALAHGYELDPSDPTNLRSPLQTSGSYASRVQPDGDALFSLSGSDAAAGLGIAANGGRLVDAVDIVAFFDHGNDRKAAMAAVLAEADANDPTQDFSHPLGATGGGGGGFLMPLAEMMRHRGAAEWVLHNHIERGATVLLIGSTGVGKSFLAVDWACCVATGTSWAGFASRRGAVVYLAGEGLRGFAKRCAAWAQHRRVDITEAPIFFNRSAVQLIDSASCRAASNSVAAMIQERGPVELIVVDTFNRIGGGDESSNSDVAKVLHNIEEFFTKRFNAAVLVVHHPGHGDSDRARGAYALPAGVDQAFLLKGGELRNTKQKEIELLPPSFLSREVVTLKGWEPDPHTGEVPTSCVLNASTAPVLPSRAQREADAQATLLQLIDQCAARGLYCNPAINSTTSVFKLLSKDPAWPTLLARPGDADRVLSEAERAGYIERVGYKTRTRKDKKRWSLTAIGRAYCFGFDPLGAPANSPVLGQEALGLP